MKRNDSRKLPAHSWTREPTSSAWFGNRFLPPEVLFGTLIDDISPASPRAISSAIDTRWTKSKPARGGLVRVEIAVQDAEVIEYSELTGVIVDFELWDSAIYVVARVEIGIAVHEHLLDAWHLGLYGNLETLATIAYPIGLVSMTRAAMSINELAHGLKSEAMIGGRA